VRALAKQAGTLPGAGGHVFCLPACLTEQGAAIRETKEESRPIQAAVMMSAVAW
jgi:hypothetical protein